MGNLDRGNIGPSIVKHRTQELAPKRDRTLRLTSTQDHRAVDERLKITTRALISTGCLVAATQCSS